MTRKEKVWWDREKVWAWVRAGEETEKLSVSEQIIESASNKQDSNREEVDNNRDTADRWVLTQAQHKKQTPKLGG